MRKAKEKVIVKKLIALESLKECELLLTTFFVFSKPALGLITNAIKKAKPINITLSSIYLLLIDFSFFSL